MKEASAALTSVAAPPLSGRPMAPFVSIDPRDDPAAIMRVIREEDPADWRSKVEVVDRWGVLEGGDRQETGPESGMARAMRQMQTQMIYSGRDSPEVQFIKKVSIAVVVTLGVNFYDCLDYLFYVESLSVLCG